MATHEYDAVIIGSGHNGLIVGNYLAMAGLSVCVLEANDMIGGCTTTVECTLPGFKHDIGSVALGAIQSNPVYANDELGIREKYGFEFIDTKKNGATLYPDGTGVVEDGDLAHELAQIAAYSPEDAHAYGQFIQEKARLLPLISTGMSTCPPPMGLFVNQLNSTPEGRDLFKSMSMSALQMARQWFKHPKTISHVLKISTEVMVTPEDAGSAMWMMFVTVGNAFRSGSLPKGGSIALPNALAAALKDRGGEIILNKKVVKINVEDGRAVSVETADGDTYVGTKAIISNVDARRVFLEMVDGYELDPKFKRDLEQIIPAPMSGVMQAVAIDDAPHYKAGPEFDDAVVVEPIPENFQDLLDGYRAMVEGRLPEKRSLCPESLVPSLFDPERAPEGKHVLYLWQLAPAGVGEEGMDWWKNHPEEVEQFARDIREHFFSYTNNLSEDNVLAYKVFTPDFYSEWNDNIIDGNITGPGAYLFQSYAYRPLPEIGQFRTMIDGLYLTGMGTHPGGAVTGGGRGTAQIILDDLGFDWDDVLDNK